jgi:hypothetical protein
MTNPMIKIHNTTTGEIIEREMTPEEIDPTLTWTKNQKDEFKAQQKIELQKAIDRAAILDRLGLTADELKTILG